MICNQIWESLNIPKNSKILTCTKCHISVKEKVCQWKTEDSANYQENIDGFDTLNMPNVGSYSSMLPYFYSCETSSKRPKKQSQMLEAQIENFQFGIYKCGNNYKARKWYFYGETCHHREWIPTLLFCGENIYRIDEDKYMH